MVRLGIIGTLIVVLICGVGIATIVWALNRAAELSGHVRQVKSKNRSEADWTDLAAAWHLVALAGFTAGVSGACLIWAIPESASVAIIVIGAFIFIGGCAESDRIYVVKLGGGRN